MPNLKFKTRALLAMLPDDVYMPLRAGATLLTATQRLARELREGYGARMRQEGHAAWESPDVLPWSAWLQRSWDEALGLVLPDPAASRQRLTPAQELAVWERIIADSPHSNALLQIPATARAARDAWRLACEWNLSPPEKGRYSEDVDAFAAWARVFAATCARQDWQDSARLPDVLAQAYAAGRLAAPARLLLAGFDILPSPQRDRVLAALRAAGTEVTEMAAPAEGGHAVRAMFADAREEMAAAARWARARLETGGCRRIGIVAPDLEARRQAVLRIFDAVLLPDAAIAADRQTARPYNVSLGQPLSVYPVVDTAFLLLALATAPLRLEEAGALLRSPFLAGAEQEMTGRALLDARLREAGMLQVELQRLGELAGASARDARRASPILAERLRRMTAAVPARTARHAPGAWAETFARLLALAGWPGERALSSEEYQTVERFRELLSDLAQLDPVLPPIRRDEALSRLRRLAADAVFQPESPAVPIQVLGVLEAAGLQFDALWIMGLQDEVWPPAARPNPFLPVEWQRRHGLPHASAEQELAFARIVTGRLSESAREIVMSCPRREGDQDLRASPLILDLPLVEADAIGVPEAADYDRQVFGARALHWLEDGCAPPLPPGSEARRGTQLFKAQAACPFKAFAEVRLGAAALARPQPGFDASTRGRLVHRALEVLWRELETHAALCALTEQERGDRIRRAVLQAIAREARDCPQAFTPRLTALEQTRLERLLEAWLELERARAPFTVVEPERAQSFTFGGVTVQTQIDRLDRLADGRHAVIDYKTGTPSVDHWFGLRPEEPQLPLYSLAPGLDVAAVLFAQVRTGDMKFIGIAQAEEIAPPVKAYADTRLPDEHGGWEDVFRRWRAVLDELGAAFRGGDARVDPKRYPDTCQYCELQPLCRIHEDPAAFVQPGDGDHG